MVEKFSKMQLQGGGGCLLSGSTSNLILCIWRKEYICFFLQCLSDAFLTINQSLNVSCRVTGKIESSVLYVNKNCVMFLFPLVQ